MSCSTVEPPTEAVGSADAVEIAMRAERAAEPSGWDATMASWKAAVEEAAAIPEGEEHDEQRDAADAAADQALEALFHFRAPDVATMAAKGRLAIKELFRYGAREGAEDPAYISHLLTSNDWTDQVLISLYQDAAALSGSHDIGAARPDGFNAADWLAGPAIPPGAFYRWVIHEDRTPDGMEFGGPSADDAKAAFDALPDWHQVEVKNYLRNQASRLNRSIGSRKARWEKPSGKSSLLRMYAAMAALTAAPDDEERRATIRHALRDTLRLTASLPVGLDDFRVDAFAESVFASGCRFVLTNPLFGPEILHPAGDERSEVEGLVEQFCSLDTFQVTELTDFLAERRRIAAEWIAAVEEQTGCVIDFQDGRIGFGIGPDHEGRIEKASDAFNGLEPQARAYLKDYGWSLSENDAAAQPRMSS